MESDIVRTICDYLELKRHFFWRNNNIPVYDTKREAYRAMPKYTPKGLPDIILIKDGRFVGIEVKNAKGKLSPHQEVFSARCKQYGALYHVVRSLDDVIKLGL